MNNWRDHRHLFDHGLAQTIKCGRHVAPAKDGLAFLDNEGLEILDAEIARGFILR